MTNAPAISVVICSHNPRRDYLDRVLGALRAQTLPFNQWEILLVDNASAESVKDRCDLSWHPRARVVREEKVGKIHALLTAIRQTESPLIAIVDDDNIVASDYLAVGMRLGTTHPHLGAWGGSCLPEFEIQPPGFLQKYLNRLAVSTVTRARWSNSYVDFDAIPPGAGMILRREIAERYRGLVENDPVRTALGPTGKHLTRCDDTDLAWTAIDAGLGLGRFPELQLTHLIPRRRVEPDYMLELIEGDAASRVVLDRIRGLDTVSSSARGVHPLRALWLRYRLPKFDYEAWEAARRGVRLGIEMLRKLGL